MPVKGAIWMYFWLLIFEGVLRKWVLPQYSDWLFVVRDPVVVLIYLLALRAGFFPVRPAVIVVALMALLSLVFALTQDTPLTVVIFGLRTDYLHLPLIFVMAAVLDRDDVRSFGRWFMILAVPVLLLMLAQFNAGQSSWLNVGVGGGEGAQLHGAMGKIRPPGPFSFITGPVLYFGIVAAYVCHGWLERRSYPRWLVFVGAVAMVAAVPISISRSLLLGVLTVVAFAGVAALRNVRSLPRVVGPLMTALALLALSADTIYVQAFVTRWDEANAAGHAGFYGNVVERILGTFTDWLGVAASAPLLGNGIGLGTIAGARLMTGKFSFALAESELTRNILELGPVLGIGFIGWRVWLAATTMLGGWRAMNARNDALPWLLAGASALNIVIGQWGQATELGFAVFGAGLALAALNHPDAENDPAGTG